MASTASGSGDRTVIFREVATGQQLSAPHGEGTQNSRGRRDPWQIAAIFALTRAREGAGPSMLDWFREGGLSEAMQTGWAL
jgi:hypothetical protein